MVFGLLKYGLNPRFQPKQFIKESRDLKPSYDVIILGGGGLGVGATRPILGHLKAILGRLGAILGRSWGCPEII